MKIGIVGSGFVGATAAYAMVMRGVGREIVLVDANRSRSLAEADDILHAVPFSHQLEVKDGDFGDLQGCRVVVIAAGANQRPGETRLELLGRNAGVFRDVVPKILNRAPEAILVVATNPVDVMTHVAAQIAAERGISPGRVIGSGTTLDTARFRALLGRHLGVDPNHVHAYVLGEHGDSEVLTWSLVTIGGLSLEEFCKQRSIRLDETVRQEIDLKVRKAAYTIISGKGATYYGIGGALARITEVILRDQRSLLTVCTPLKDVFGVKNVTVSMPHLVGGEGILSTFPPVVDENERELLRKSASLIADVITQLNQSGA
ncbi:MAG: L-lactate dehydrogenase [Ignavibacteriales bacterium]|nr:L-lactate dehydrogenase [Ignavibacteriales bacterium]